jgi:predicted amidohydrolase
MQNLSVTLVQSDLHWENPVANLSMFEEKLSILNSPTDLIILPEMFTTGFTMNAHALAEPANSTTTKWLKMIAQQHNALVMGSIITKENQKYFNRLLAAYPNGEIMKYDKRHLFRMAGEDATYSPGNELLIVKVNEWRIAPFVCYDLRFPVWSRNTNLQYDMAIYIANWPQTRRLAWSALLTARAIENLCYVAGVNRIGLDGKGIQYTGDSCVINYKGETLYNSENKDEVCTIILSKEELVSFREKFPAHLDADQFTLLA